jgi:anhydro-N-acetylmuramic acid kinase
VGGDRSPRVRRSDDVGLAANHVEALAFAWLARAALEGIPGNLPAVTGARGRRVLGAIYPR